MHPTGEQVDTGTPPANTREVAAPPPSPSSPPPPALLPDSIEGLALLQVPPDLRLLAAERIVGNAGEDRGGREAAARKFVEAAGQLGIDVSLMWGTLDPSGRYFHQVCLAVIGAGRTAMLFMSDDEAGPEWDFGFGSHIIRRREVASGVAQRELLVRHVCRHLKSLRGPIPGRSVGHAKGSTRLLDPDQPSVILVQGLLETDEHEAADALSRAGFLRLGDLVYMRRPLAGAASKRLSRAAADTPAWPAGITVRPLSDIDPALHHSLLARALSRSYIDTLDCPELCGLRSIDDVIDSHRAVGDLNLATWWIIQSHGDAEGAMLLTECPDQRTVELVYLGLSPTLRGRGLGAGLLKMGLAAVSGAAATAITCAVDSRNTPAMKLYKRAGFQRFSTRLPLVKGLGD